MIHFRRQFGDRHLFFRSVGVITVCFFSIISAKGQNKRIHISLSNNVTALPVLGYTQVFYRQFHPGAEISQSWKINKRVKNRFYLNATAGFYYHRFIQTLLWIYPSVNYERSIGTKFSAGIGIGAGYGFSIEGSQVFKLNSDGNYEKKHVLAGRSQYIGQLELNGRYALRKDHPDGIKLMLQLKTFLQGTYINNYVPVLPVNSILMGVSIPMKSK